MYQSSGGCCVSDSEDMKVKSVRGKPDPWWQMRTEGVATVRRDKDRCCLKAENYFNDYQHQDSQSNGSIYIWYIHLLYISVVRMKQMANRIVQFNYSGVLCAFTGHKALLFISKRTLTHSKNLIQSVKSDWPGSDTHTYIFLSVWDVKHTAQ